ncbi:MAG: glycosyltransferase family 9 protein [Chthoniobacterales bacterium]
MNPTEKSANPRPSAVIVRADHIGDLVLTTPMIRALAKAGWDVDVVAPPIVKLLEGNPHVRSLYDLRAICPDWPAGWGCLAAFLRRRKYKAVLLPFARPLPLLYASALSGARHRIAMWAGIAGRLTGHTCVRSGFHDEARPYAQTILRALGPLRIPDDGIRPELFPTQQEIHDAHAALDAHLLPGVRVAIHPLCLGNTCNLPPAEYATLARRILAETNWSIAITGAQGDDDALSKAGFPQGTDGRLWMCCGMFDLRGLAALFTSLDVVVVPSTGPLHIAHAVGAKTLTPFCPQIPVCGRIWGHESLGDSVIEPVHPPCDPTGLHGPHCDFKGRLTADDLFARLARQISRLK